MATAAALRAVEMNCDALLKATQVDGVYNADPKRNANAVRYDRIIEITAQLVDEVGPERVSTTLVAGGLLLLGLGLGALSIGIARRRQAA